jgi:hypothetical protein
MSLLYLSEPPRPRAHELAAAALVAAVLAARGRAMAGVLAAALYAAYLCLDWRWVRPSRLAKWVRNTSPIVFLLASGPGVLRALGAPGVAAGAALWAMTAGALFPYLYDRARTSLAFVRGVVLAFALEVLAQWLWPAAAGPHAALALYAAAFGVGARTVFWRYAAPVLLVYAMAVSVALGWTPGLALHLAAGLVAAAAALAAPYRGRTAEGDAPAGLAPTVRGEPAPSLAPAGPIE